MEGFQMAYPIKEVKAYKWTEIMSSLSVVKFSTISFNLSPLGSASI
jgi:hypothetical protein